MAWLKDHTRARVREEEAKAAGGGGKKAKASGKKKKQSLELSYMIINNPITSERKHTFRCPRMAELCGTLRVQNGNVASESALLCAILASI